MSRSPLPSPHPLQKRPSPDRSFGLNRSFREGYTLLELVIASTLGLAVISLSATAVLFNRGLLLRDTARVEINQSLRASLDIIGADIRQAGENLIRADFPIIIVTDDPVNGDTLTVRRGFSVDILTVCANVTGANLVVADTTGTYADCLPAGRTLDPLDTLPDNIYNWQQNRINNSGLAFIYDPDSRDGEFFTYINEVRDPAVFSDPDDPATFTIESSSGTWSGTYLIAGDRPSLAILSEQQYFIDADGFLTVQVNGDASDRRRMAEGITDFQVRIIQQDGTVLETFGNSFGDDWSTIQSVEVTLAGASEFAANRNIENTFTSNFLPRNVMSF